VIPPRPTFAADMTETESAFMSKHVAYWTDLLDKDVASGVWPVAEPSGLYGMAVVEAPDEQEVRMLAERDPVISTGLFTYEVFTMP
jgi:hypothetical protein